MAVIERCGSGAPPSLYEVAVREADRHKWLVSERHGCDCGHSAWSEWWDKHWPHFCRHRRIEHVCGKNQWREFEDDAFGRFYDQVVAGDLLMDRILDRVAYGWENLHFMWWVQDWELPTERVIEILEVVNINTAARLAPKG